MFCSILKTKANCIKSGGSKKSLLGSILVICTSSWLLFASIFRYIILCNSGAAEDQDDEHPTVVMWREEGEEEVVPLSPIVKLDMGPCFVAFSSGVWSLFDFLVPGGEQLFAVQQHVLVGAVAEMWEKSFGVDYGHLVLLIRHLQFDALAQTGLGFSELVAELAHPGLELFPFLAVAGGSTHVFRCFHHRLVDA